MSRIAKSTAIAAELSVAHGRVYYFGNHSEEK